MRSLDTEDAVEDVVPQHLSMVVPVYSGEHFLEDLVTELMMLSEFLQAHDAPLRVGEIVFVDDESRDDSGKVLKKLEESNPLVSVVTMSRNFGQHGATIGGILHTTGDWVITLDEDLQHRPHEIPRLLAAAVTSELDLVYGYPSGRAHSVFRDWASRSSKRAIAAISGAEQLTIASSFRLVRGSVARAAASTASHHAYLDVALSWFTTRATRIEIDTVDIRTQNGEASGYSFRRLLGHMRRALTTGDMRALRLVGGVGLIGVVAAVVLSIRFLVLILAGDLDRTAIGWPSTFAALLFFGGIIVTQLVVLAEYSVSSALHLRGKPAYFAVDRSNDAALAEYFSHNPTLLDASPVVEAPKLAPVDSSEPRLRDAA